VRLRRVARYDLVGFLRRQCRLLRRETFSDTPKMILQPYFHVHLVLARAAILGDILDQLATAPAGLAFQIKNRRVESRRVACDRLPGMAPPPLRYSSSLELERVDRSRCEGRRKSGSHRTRRWREMDSNLRFRNRSVPISGQPVRLPSRLTASRPGTGSSNPFPSSRESDANLTFRGRACETPKASAWPAPGASSGPPFAIIGLSVRCDRRAGSAEMRRGRGSPQNPGRARSTRSPRTRGRKSCRAQKLCRPGAVGSIAGPQTPSSPVGFRYGCRSRDRAPSDVHWSVDTAG
jgi:hypothetical protein